ncbi:hypothetical protein BH23PLA1_BH23PLA1_28730 [soil metagenome]
MSPSNPVEADRRYFTVEQANKTLPLVRVIVSDIVMQWKVVSELEERLAPMLAERRRGQVDPYSEELAHSQTELEAARDALRRYLEELEKLGVELKGAHNGLCDFPSLKDGREVYLCWKLGESEIRHWHELEAGYAGREPLTPELIAQFGQVEDGSA